MNDSAPFAKPSLVRRILRGPRELRAGWRLLVFLLVVAASLRAGNLAIRTLLHGAPLMTVFLVREVLDFVVFLLASWLMGRLEHRTIGDYGLPGRRMFRAQFWQGAALGLAAVTALLLAMRAVGVLRFAGVALHGLDAWKWAVAWTLVFVLVALREEFRMRGYGLFTLASGVGFWPAAILTSGLFAYAHHANSGESWLGLLNAGIYGLLACLLLRRSGDLWMPIGVHTAFDWGETYVYGVANSGHVLPGHLLGSATSGPAWLSGGTAGPEGSVLCTLVFGATAWICAMRMRGARYPRPASVGRDLAGGSSGYHFSSAVGP